MVMGTYRFLAFSEGSQVLRTFKEQCADNEEAMEHAAPMDGEHRVEVWLSGRKVGETFNQSLVRGKQ